MRGQVDDRIGPVADRVQGSGECEEFNWGIDQAANRWEEGSLGRSGAAERIVYDSQWRSQPQVPNAS